MRSAIAALTLVAAATDPLAGQTIQGVWKPVEVVVDSGPSRGRHTTDVQPGLLVFTKRHYSMMFVQGFAPRAVPGDSATDAQVALLFIPFTANAGTYKRTDSTVTFTPKVAKHPAVMAGGPFMLRVRVKGDTLWVTGAPGTPAGDRWTWVRVERP
jgi:hypothetical protein